MVPRAGTWEGQSAPSDGGRLLGCAGQQEAYVTGQSEPRHGQGAGGGPGPGTWRVIYHRDFEPCRALGTGATGSDSHVKRSPPLLC